MRPPPYSIESGEIPCVVPYLLAAEGQEGLPVQEQRLLLNSTALTVQCVGPVSTSGLPKSRLFQVGFPTPRLFQMGFPESWQLHMGFARCTYQNRNKGLIDLPVPKEGATQGCLCSYDGCCLA